MQKKKSLCQKQRELETQGKNVQASNDELRKKYLSSIRKLEEAIALSEKDPEEKLLSNKSVATLLRGWADDMGHIVELLGEIDLLIEWNEIASRSVLDITLEGRKAKRCSSLRMKHRKKYN